MDIQNTAFLSISTGRTPGTMALQVIGSAVYHFPFLDSTNAFALKLLSRIRPKDGTVIVAGYQTAGRGQIGRGWHSAPGRNLCLSCIVYPEIRPQEQFRLTVITALAVYDTVENVLGSADISIKWPNDIYVGNKKIAGILIQTSIQGNRITSCVCGIGLNVNETAFPKDLPNPTSLILELKGKTVPWSGPKGKSHGDNDLDLATLQQTLLSSLNKRMFDAEHSSEKLFEAYHRVLYRRNVLSDFVLPDGSQLRGAIRGVDSQGRLLIEWEDGNIVAYGHREIDYLI